MAKDMKKELTVITAHSVREIVEAINEKGIQKEDILKLFDMHGMFFLLYYK